MNDRQRIIELKTEASYASMTSSSNSANDEPASASTQYLTAQCSSSSGEGSWDSHIQMNSIKLCPEILIQDNHKEIDISTSADTVIDTEEKFEPKVEEIENSKENSNLDYQFVYCIAAINRMSSSPKILGISVIDTSIKTDGSSLNGYAADRSGSSTNSTVYGPIEEPFLVPKVPCDSLISLSSSNSSSNGVFVNQSKLKPKYNVLLPKNVNIYPDRLMCNKCDHVYQGVPGNFNSLDVKNFINEPQLPTKKPRSRKKSKQLNKTDGFSITKKNTRKTLKTMKEGTGNENEEQQNNILTDTPADNCINNPIVFDTCDKVLAYWVTDKLFYPATIIDILPQKYEVQFISDHVIKTVNADALVHSSALKPGTSVAVLDTVSQECKFGDIVSINSIPHGEDTYTIDLGSEIVDVTFDNLVLSVEKARMLQCKVQSKSYDRLSVSNVSEGKRLCRTRSTNAKIVNKTNLKNESNKRKNTAQEIPENAKKKRCLFPDKNDPRNIPSTSSGITREITSLSSSESDFDKIRESLYRLDVTNLKASDIDTEYSSCGDNNIVLKDSPNSKYKPEFKPFEGLHFIITYSKFKRSGEEQKKDYCPTSSEFKKYLFKKIPKYGGTAHRCIAEVKKSLYPYCYIISDTYCQTCNYFVGLINGLRPYHHKYIDMAIEQKKPFTEVIANVDPLPNGLSLELQRPIYGSSQTNYRKLFKDFIVYVSAPTENCAEYYATLVKYGGGLAYTKWKEVKLPLTHHSTVIIADESCDPSILQYKRVPKLNYKWLLQSIIHGEVRSTDNECYVLV